jgi:hypothetical protein
MLDISRAPRLLWQSELTLSLDATRPRIRWGWISAVALGCLLGLLVAAMLGVTGARLGAPDDFDLEGVSSGSQ